MEWLNEKRNSDDFDNIKYEIPKSWIHIHYYEALNILFRFENSLRVLVYSVLKINKGIDWINTSISVSDSINNAFKQRSDQNKKYGYLGQDTDSPMMYLNSGELIYIVDKNWEMFSQYFSADRQIILNKLLEINAIRNSFAHFRPITKEDIELLKQNISHIFFKTYGYFNSLSNLFDNVPTNTKEAWYNDLKSLSYKNCDLSFSSSNDEHFVEIVLKIKLPNISTAFRGRWGNVRTAAIDLPRFFKFNKELIQKTLYIKDGVYFEGLEKDSDNIISNSSSLRFYFVFSRKILHKECQNIVSLFDKMFSQIEDDLETINTDDQARGIFLSTESIHCKVNDNSNKWQSSGANIRSELLKNLKLISSVEYWGEYGMVDSDYITKQHIIPWIPEPISEELFPF